MNSFAWKSCVPFYINVFPNHYHALAICYLVAKIAFTATQKLQRVNLDAKIQSNII